MVMKNILKGLLLFSIFGSVSCETMKDPETKYASTFPISGEYWVQYSHINDAGVKIYPFDHKEDYKALYIYNTSANNGAEVWITDTPNADDDANFWQYRAKISCSPASKAFGLAPLDSVINDIYGYDIKVAVYNGKIISSAALQPSGVMADSISFDLILEDTGAFSAAGDTIKVNGFRKTGFTEDGH